MTYEEIKEIAESEETQPAKRRSGPKSVPKSNPIEQVKELRIVLEKVDNDSVRLTRASKRKAELMSTSEENLSSLDPEPKSTEDSQPTQEIKQSKSFIRNTDKTHTVESHICLLCNKKCSTISSHYNSHHEGYEVYSARMSESNSTSVKRNPPKDSYREQGKLVAFCHYCNSERRFERYKWIEHLSRHTGEYIRQCNKCETTITSTTESNGTCSNCANDMKIKLVPMAQFTDTLHVYMCNLCNFTQSQEENMKKHIRTMHECPNESTWYTKIILIPNFSQKNRTAHRSQSTTSESETQASNNEEIVNQDVFKSSNQNDDDLSDAATMQLMRDSFSNSTDIRPATTTSESIVDRLKERFRKQQESSNNPQIKEETEDTPNIVYRGPDEMSVDERRNETTKSNSFVEGDAIEDGCKIELNKSAVMNDVDDHGWESYSDDDEDVSPTKASNNLSRLIIGKGKTKPTKPRMKPKKRADKSILTSMIVKKEKSDEIIDLDADIKQEKSPEKSPEIQPIQPIMGQEHRVDNIAYSECLGAQKYHCFIGDCGFVSQNNPGSLSNHLRQKHFNGAWNGFCHKCDQQILNNKYSLIKEYDHLMSVHVPSTPTLKPTPTVNAIVQPPEIEPEIPAPKPALAIRIRRFSGDILSGPSNDEQPNSIKSHTIVRMPNLSTGTSYQGPNTTFDTITESISNDNPLKPWTKCANTKSAIAEEKLKRDFSLVALFKCMAIDCIFTTSDEFKMRTHLQNHEDSLEDSLTNPNNDADDSSWQECCYCEEIPGTCNLLVDHIIKVHSSSIFQCPYCFYRSADRYNVMSHAKKYHPKTTETHVFVCGDKSKNLADEIQDILRAQLKVQEFKCLDVGKFNFTFE